MTRLSTKRLLRCLAIAALALASACGGEEDTARPPISNVVVIVVDSLRADHLGLYGYDRPTSPFLDAFASQSIVYDAAWAPSSYTSQSVAAILTGRLPTSGGSTGLMEAEPSSAASTLANDFRRNGGRTGFFSNQSLLTKRGFTRGFEDVGIDDSNNAAEVADQALQFLDDIAGEPFLIYAHLAEPHQPYSPTAEDLDLFLPADAGPTTVPEQQDRLESGATPTLDDPAIAWLVAAYDAEVLAADIAIRRLVEGLEARELTDRTLIVVTGSQGEEFLDHGWLGHAWTLHEESLRVPLLISAPGLEPRRVNGPVSLVDLSPSIRTAAGLIEATGDGESLLQIDEGGLRAVSSGRPRIAELVIRERCIHRAVRDGDWKYIATSIDCPLGERRSISSDYIDRLRVTAETPASPDDLWPDPVVEQLFDLSADPGEQNDLSSEQPDRLDAMRRVLANYRSHCRENGLDAARAVAPAEQDADSERLESLGYL